MVRVARAKLNGSWEGGRIGGKKHSKLKYFPMVMVSYPDHPTIHTFNPWWQIKIRAKCHWGCKEMCPLLRGDPVHPNVHSIKRGSNFFKVIELLTQLKRWVWSRLWVTFLIVTFSYRYGIQILYKYFANIMQILSKYFINISLTLYIYDTNILWVK